MSGGSIVLDAVSVRFRSHIERGRRRDKAALEVPALTDVSVSIASGETLGVIGPNGAGKSTLLRVIAETVRPDEGTVTNTIGGATLLELGVGFNLALSGRDNVMLGGLAAGQQRADLLDRFDEIVLFSELGDAIDRPVSTYSSGMRSRLAFAIGMTLEPDVLLLDELLAVGDASFRRKSADAMQRLHERAGTIIVVSHSMGRVRNTCDRVLWLEQGRVVAIGDAAEVVDAYLDSVRDPLESAASKPLDEWTARERTAVVLRVVRGEPMHKVAKEFGISPQEIAMWRTRYKRAGRRSLRTAVLKKL